MKIELAQSGLHSQHTDVASAVAWTSSGSLVSAGLVLLSFSCLARDCIIT